MTVTMIAMGRAQMILLWRKLEQSNNYPENQKFKWATIRNVNGLLRRCCCGENLGKVSRPISQFMDDSLHIYHPLPT